MTEIAKAEHILAGLRAKRDAAVARGIELGEERTTLAFAAHASDDAKARKRLDELNREAALHDSELRSLDAAIAEAAKRVTAAQAAEARAADRVRAEEARKTVAELAEVFAYTDKHLLAALKGLIAIERGVEELHQKDVAFPTAVQLRLGIVAVLGTWLQQLPKMWWNELSAGLRYRAPADRQSAMSYWAQIEPSLRNQIGARTGEVEPTKRRVGEKEEAA
jgi:hypothetical protein